MKRCGWLLVMLGLLAGISIGWYGCLRMVSQATSVQVVKEIERLQRERTELESQSDRLTHVLGLYADVKSYHDKGFWLVTGNGPDAINLDCLDQTKGGYTSIYIKVDARNRPRFRNLKAGQVLSLVPRDPNSVLQALKGQFIGMADLVSPEVVAPPQAPFRRNQSRTLM